MSRFLLAIFAALLLTASSCTKCDDRDAQPCTRRMRYAQTMCADPWGPGNLGGEATARLAGDFLRSKDILATDIALLDGGQAEFCEACACRTGKLLYVTVPQSLVEQMQDYGFVMTE